MVKFLKYAFLGFVSTFLPLAAIDYVLHYAFLKNGNIDNNLVADILSFQFTRLQATYIFIIIFAITSILIINLVLSRKEMRLQKLKDNKSTGTAFGCVLTAVLLVIPLFKPDDYDRLIGLAIFITVIYRLSRKLIVQ